MLVAFLSPPFLSLPLGGVTLLGTRPVRPAALLNASVSEELLHIRMFFCVLKGQVPAKFRETIELRLFFSCSHAHARHVFRCAQRSVP